MIKTHKDWEEKLDKVVDRTFGNILTQLVKTNKDYPAGEAALTATSMSVGKHIAPLIQREPLSMVHQLALGDILIEGFVYHGLLELIAPMKRHESYMLRATPKWDDEFEEISREVIVNNILGSFEERPAPANAKVHKMHDHLFVPDAPYVKAIDKLQSVQWSINTRVLDAIKKNSSKFIDHETADNDAKEQRRRSKLTEWRFITVKAEELQNYDGFYQTFEVDYRGRMYNTEPFLNFQGNDIAKGLLQFHKVKKIDEGGRFWLAVHTAASYNESYSKDNLPDWCQEDYRSYLDEEELDDISVDKMTLNDRALWTINNMDRILEWAAEDSIQTKAEKPVTFLACCYEWEALETSEYTSLPISIDGSNNGWQHLGAISKDPHTGLLVGLVPTVIQKDFYVQTAKELINLAQDQVLIDILEQMPMKHIRKGISKRGSMTRAYSAGAKKIGENMYFDCKTEDFHEKYSIKQKDCLKLAHLLVKAIENVCPGPLQTMKYLQNLAQYQLGKHDVTGPGDAKKYKSLKGRRTTLIRQKDLSEEELDELNLISSTISEYSYELVYGEGEDHIQWSTPSGFVARYEKYVNTDFKRRATLNGKQIKHVLKVPTERPDVQGFMSGISPNYIHSMDAAHMALVIADWEGDFGAVHDSFSTHASDVDELLERTKSVFINMYSKEDFFEDIRQNITGGKDNVEKPTLGELDIGGIYDSDYFFA